MICIAEFSAIAVHAAPAAGNNDEVQWKYYKGKTELPHNWHDSNFDDLHWENGVSGFGYGNHKSKTVLKDMRGHYKRVHARRTFEISSPSAVRKMFLSVICDGPFIAYLNGIEVLRNNEGMPVLNHGKGKGRPLQIEITGFSHELHRGANVISFQCENDDVNSEDYSFEPYFEILEK